MILNRQILHNRHRLSERQVNDFLGEDNSKENSQNRMVGMQRIGSFLEMAKLLKIQNIKFINLKGALLSQRIYNDPLYRYSRDFDILVDSNRVNQTLQLLQKEGFHYSDFKWPESKKKQEITLHFLNQIEMSHEELGVMIEIHWKLFSTRITDQQTLDTLVQENIETVEFGDVELNRFSIEFELFYLIVHGGNHAWFRLKWLVDIHEILNRKEIDWEKFNQIVAACNAHRLVDICNTMLLEYFPEGKRLRSQKAGSHSLESFAIEQCRQPEGDPHINRINTTRLTLYRWKLFPHWQHKLDVTKVITFCKTDLKYNWLLPRRFVYYLFRPVGYVLRGIGVLK